MLGDVPKSTEYYYKAIEVPAGDLLGARILYDDSHMKMLSRRWIEAGDGLKKVISMGQTGKPNILTEQARLCWLNQWWVQQI